MKRMMTGVEDLLSEQIIEQAKDMIDRQKKEQRELVEKEVYDVNFRLEFDKSSFMIVGMMWIVFLIVFLKAFAGDLFHAYQNGALFDLASYSTWKIVMIIITLVAVLFGSVFYIICALKPLPRIQNTSMFYRGKRYHYSEITKLVMMRRVNMTKVYLNGKYKFWISPDYKNYRSFIEWAGKCNIPMEGDTSIRGLDVDFEATQKIVIIVTVIVAVIMVAFAVALPMITVMNR